MTRASIIQPDVTLHLDLGGVIRDVTLSAAIADEGVEGWVGRPWVETVGEFGGDKVARMIADATATGVSAFRQVTQCFPSGLELPIEYTTVRLGGRAGLIAVGKNLQTVSELQSRLIAAQLAMERDYWKLRDVETRYRLLFDASNDAVLLIRASDLAVVEANPAAIRALGIAPAGRDFLSELPAEERQAFREMLDRVRENGRAPAVVAHLGPERESWLMRASLMIGEPGQVFLLQLARTGLPRPALLPPAPGRNEPASFEDLVERIPDGFVVVDEGGTVLRANRAFLDLVQMAAEPAVIGERLRRWLSRPGADAPVLIAAIRRNGAVRIFPTAITSELGLESAVEISGVGDADEAPTSFGLLIRDVTQRPRAAAPDALPVLRPGDAPLHDVVRIATERVERQAIDAALEITGGNRTAAAELLGLSRQSLYVKLNRYSIDDGRGSGPGEEE